MLNNLTRLESVVGRPSGHEAKTCQTIQFVISRTVVVLLLTAIPSPALSPFQTRAMPNLIRSYLFNGYRRLSAEAFYFVVPFGLGSLRLIHGHL